MKLVLLLFVLPCALLGVAAGLLVHWLGAGDELALVIGTQVPVFAMLGIWAAAIWTK